MRRSHANRRFRPILTLGLAVVLGTILGGDLAAGEPSPRDFPAARPLPYRGRFFGPTDPPAPVPDTGRLPVPHPEPGSIPVSEPDPPRSLDGTPGDRAHRPLPRELAFDRSRVAQDACDGRDRPGDLREAAGAGSLDPAVGVVAALTAIDQFCPGCTRAASSPEKMCAVEAGSQAERPDSVARALGLSHRGKPRGRPVWTSAIARQIGSSTKTPSTTSSARSRRPAPRGRRGSGRRAPRRGAGGSGPASSRPARRRVASTRRPRRSWCRGTRRSRWRAVLSARSSSSSRPFRPVEGGPLNVNNDPTQG